MKPTVSVIMPARDVEAFVTTAVLSVTSQTLANIELIVVDDGSRDTTAQIVERLALQDARIRLITGTGTGPAAARNLALSLARGEWVAIVDADDEIIADRLARLSAIGEAERAQIVADNVTAWYEDGSPTHVWMAGEAWATARDIDLAAVLNTDKRVAEIGYLKPLFRLDFIRKQGIRYDEELLIGEDYDFVLRLLAAGARYRFDPHAGYRYRRRSGSISHRANEAQLASMARALARVRETIPASLHPLADERISRLREGVYFDRLVHAMKSRDVSAAAPLLLRPRMVVRLAEAAAEGLGGRLRRAIRRT